MIPEELHLRNFLSHRETDLDLRGVHLASLVGENGAGKSALLDAITWVVWGRSRAPYGHDDDLVYHGENSLEVEYVFRMPYQGGTERHCRILRRREQRGRRSTGSILDFQMEADDGWRSLTSDSIRQTQATIIEYLGLDYDTFINSAYLRQGHADEFTIQTASERKRVLSAILGLDRWAEYLDRAKKQLSRVQGQLQIIDRRLDEAEQELARRPEYEAALETAEAQAAEAEARLREVQAHMDEMHRVQEQALALRRQIAEIDARIVQEEARLTQLHEETEVHQGRRTYYADMVAQAAAIESAYAAYQHAVADERAWGEKLAQAAQLQQEKSQCEQAIAEARQALHEQLRAYEQEATLAERAVAEARAALERTSGDLRGQLASQRERLISPELRAELKTAEQALAQLLDTASAQAAAREDLHAAEVEIGQLTERNRQLREMMNVTKDRLDTLAEADALCPLCKQPLTPEHHQRLLTDIEAEGVKMGDEFRANTARAQSLQQQKNILQQQILEQERVLAALPRQQQRVTRLQQQVEQSTQAEERVEGLQEKIALLETRIAEGDYAADARVSLEEIHRAAADVQAQLDAKAFAPSARASLSKVLVDLKTVGYDIEAHQQVKAQLEALSSAESDYRELEKARISVDKETETLKRLALEIEAQKTRRDEVLSARDARQAELDALQPRLAEVPRLMQALNATRQEEATARQRVGAARQTLAALETLASRLAAQRSERDTLAQRVAVLTELREAFGVNGIPAMMIEHTLPELEREANRILQRLTGGRMHIRFETQRETKSGNLRETLDIIISDEKGTRPYENFSGGEQFRVNFAIRVALSRMLAQRAGVRLRSLFVDEGFGALDAEGRQRLVQAVKAVQSEFDLILVITHIDELREAFPTQIQVIKTESGSQVELV